MKEVNLRKLKTQEKKGVENMKERNEINWYTVIVFENEADRTAFMKEINIPKFEQYITEDQVRRISR